MELLHRKQDYNFRRTKEEFYNTYNSYENMKLNIFTEDVKKMLKILYDLEKMKNVMKGKKIIQVGRN
jgi:hypothetical protein